MRSLSIAALLLLIPSTADAGFIFRGIAARAAVRRNNVVFVNAVPHHARAVFVQPSTVFVPQSVAYPQTFTYAAPPPPQPFATSTTYYAPPGYSTGATYSTGGTAYTTGGYTTSATVALPPLVFPASPFHGPVGPAYNAAGGPFNRDGGFNFPGPRR